MCERIRLKGQNLGIAVPCEFSPRTRVRIYKICQDCELEISRILLTVDLKVMDMSEFDVILGMDWLTTHRVVIDCDRMRVTAYTPGGSRFCISK